MTIMDIARDRCRMVDQGALSVATLLRPDDALVRQMAAEYHGTTPDALTEEQTDAYRLRWTDVLGRALGGAA
jgi:hypothetical protein